MRWVYVARVSIASAIFLAAVLASLDQPLEDSSKLLIASLTFAATFVVTAVSLIYSRFNRGERHPTDRAQLRAVGGSPPHSTSSPRPAQP